MSLVHGGPSPGFLSSSLFSCLVDGPELAKPVCEDVADHDVYDKLQFWCQASVVGVNGMR